MHLIGNVDFRDTSNNVAIAVQLAVGVAILKTLNMNTNNITNIGSITCNTIACTGTSGKTSTPTSRGVYMGFDSAFVGGIDICADFSQYINFTTINNEFRGRMVYNTTVNDFKMYVNGSATSSLTLNSTTLTTNNITGSVGTFSWIARAGTSGRPLTPTAQGVYIVIASVGSAAIEICSTG